MHYAVWPYVLNGTARAIIEARQGHHPVFVFTDRGHPVERTSSSAWRRTWREAGLATGENVLSGPYKLRHTFARRLWLAGVPLETRKALRHHLNGDITVHYSPAELRELIGTVQHLREAQRKTVPKWVKYLKRKAGKSGLFH